MTGDVISKVRSFLNILFFRWSRLLPIPVGSSLTSEPRQMPYGGFETLKTGIFPNFARGSQDRPVLLSELCYYPLDL